MDIKNKLIVALCSEYGQAAKKSRNEGANKRE